MFKSKKFYFNLIPLILISAILFKIVFNIENLFSNVVVTLLAILTPFFWACGIAYIINPLVKWIERKFKLKRGLSLLISYIVVLILIVLAFTVIVPSILNSLSELFKNIPEYAQNTELWVRESLEKLDTSDILILNLNKIEGSILETLSKLSTVASSLLSGILAQTLKFTSSFVKFVFGFIISIYILQDKESLKANFKKLFEALLPESKASSLIEFFRESDTIFSRFIVGKTIDSLIIGILCYIGLLIINAPFAALIALLVGITNMIPYFGPFIGMVPAFILTLFVKPNMAIWVLIFIFLLQQFDGWYLGPKILGEKVGVSPFFIILAITIGGGLFGVLGMFLSVPIAAVIKIYFTRFINIKLKEKRAKKDISNKKVPSN